MDDNIPRDEIKKMLKKARFALPERIIKIEELNKLANSSKNANQFSLLIKMTFLFHQKNPQSKSILIYLQDFVSQSHYPYSEWLEAIDYFSSWLTKKNIQGCLKDIIQYISCTQEFNSNKLPQNLCTLLEIMLNSHGFDKQVKPLNIRQ